MAGRGSRFLLEILPGLVVDMKAKGIVCNSWQDCNLKLACGFGVFCVGFGFFVCFSE